MENDKSNWRNAVITSILTMIGSFIIMKVNKVPTEVAILILPFICISIFSPVLIIELLSKRGNKDGRDKLK